MVNRIKCPVCHRPGAYCFKERDCKYNPLSNHRRCKYNMGTTYGPPEERRTQRYIHGTDVTGLDRIKQHQEWMETESKFAHACPDLDQEFPADMVNRPPHYNAAGIEAIDVVEAYAPNNYHRGNALKYLLRADYKGHKKQDLEKAVWYIQREIARI